MMSIKRLLHRRNLAAWLVLLASLMLTGVTWYGLSAPVRKNAQQQFELHVRDVVDSIRDRLRQHEQILLGGAGLFDAKGEVSRANWHDYVERLHLADHYPGIQGVGFSQIIWPVQLPAHVAAIRAEGFAQYGVRPAGERPVYTSIIYLEPFTERNLAAFGFDMMSEATRAAAMRRAAESGQTAITGKVKLVQETHGKTQAGFLMYVPVYRKPQHLDSPQARWAALRGFVYSPYRINDLMRGILRERMPAVDFVIYDGQDEGDEARMYESINEHPAGPRTRPPLLRTLRTIEAYGQTWTLRLESRPEFEAGFQSPLHLLVLLLGCGISVLLFLVVSFLIFRRDQAEEIAQQMTAEIRANEEQLRMNEARLNEAQRTALVGSWELDPATGQLHWTDEVFRLCEIDKNKSGATYEGFLNVVHPEDRDAVSKAYADSLVNRQPYEISHRLRMADGRIKWVHDRCSSDFDADGKPLRSRGTVQDITHLTEVERTARESAQFTQSILDNAIDGIISIDEQGTVQSFNRAAERIFGYAAVEVIGRNINLLMPEPYHSEHDGYLRNYRDSGVPRIIGIGREVEGRRKDGGTFPMDLAVSRSEHQGKPLFIGLVRDITERKRIEQMKTEFVSTVSHELRTPLTSISGALGLVCGGALGELPEQARPMLDIAYKNSQRLTHLINDLLDMEKLAAGKMRLELQAQELMPLVEQAIESTRAYAQQYQVQLLLKERADGVRVRVDASRLQQVLSNFLSNAAKFSPQGAQVEVTVRARSGVARVAVTDHGPGIPAEFRGRIFQKFSQADSSDTRQKGGTGLGLAISKELIERMNGLVGFESQEGQGACFHFELPVLTEQAPAPDRPGEDVPGVLRLLVVEDDPDIAKLLVLMLERAGFGADVAGTGEMALQLLEQRSYAAMTLDLLLPDQSGVALIRELRGRAGFEKLPIIVVSAFLDDGKLAIDGDFAAVDWLDKPIDEGRLIAAVRRSLPALPHGKAKILHVEDDADLHHIVATLGRGVAEFDIAHSLAQARERLRQERYDLVILDIGLPDGSGWALLPEINALQPAPPVIVLSGAELSAEQQGIVHQALVKSRTEAVNLLDTIKRVIAHSTTKPGELKP